MLSFFPFLGFKTKKMIKVYIVYTDLHVVKFLDHSNQTTKEYFLYYTRNDIPVGLIKQAPRIRQGCPLYVFKNGSLCSQLHVASKTTSLILDSSRMIIEEKYYET